MDSTITDRPVSGWEPESSLFYKLKNTMGLCLTILLRSGRVCTSIRPDISRPFRGLLPDTEKTEVLLCLVLSSSHITSVLGKRRAYFIQQQNFSESFSGLCTCTEHGGPNSFNQINHLLNGLYRHHPNYIHCVFFRLLVNLEFNLLGKKITQYVFFYMFLRLFHSIKYLNKLDIKRIERICKVVQCKCMR